MTDVGRRPELAWLPVGKLKADPRYQRTIETRRGQALIERIAASFRWSAFQAILAMKAEGGGWLVLDGQHRVEAARRRKLEHVPAVVVASVSLEEQAAAFVQANRDRVAVTTYALHHANLVAGDAAAKAIDRVCRKAGVSIPRYPIPADKLKPGETLALGTIGQLIKRYGEALAALAIGAVASGHRTRVGELRAPILVAATAVLAAAPEAERAARAKILTAEIAQTAPAEIQTAAIAHRAVQGGTFDRAVEFVLRGMLGAVGHRIGPRARNSPDLAAKPSGDAAERKPAGAGAEPALLLRPDDDSAIAEHLKIKGATKIEASLDVDAVMNECRRGGDAVVALGAEFDSFNVNGSTMLDRRELLGRANRSRQKRGLPLWSPDEISWKRPPPPETEQQKRARKSHSLRAKAARLATLGKAQAAKRGVA